MVNEGFLDFFKKTQPQQVESPPVVPKPSEPKVVAPKKNAYAEQFVKIFDKLNEMATKNGFKEAKRYIEQESGLKEFTNYIEFKKGSRELKISYVWYKDSLHPLGSIEINIVDNGVGEYVKGKEVSQKEIPTVVKELFSTKSSLDVIKVQPTTNSLQSIYSDVNNVIKDIATKNGWDISLSNDARTNILKKGGETIVANVENDNGDSVIKVDEETYIVKYGDFVTAIGYVLNGEPIPDRFLVDIKQKDLSKSDYGNKDVKKIDDPIEYYDKLFSYKDINNIAKDNGWKVIATPNIKTGKYDSISYNKGNHKILIVTEPLEHPDSISITIDKTGSNYMSPHHVLSYMRKNLSGDSIITNQKIKPKEYYNKLFDFDLIQSTAVNKGWKVEIESNKETGKYDSILFTRGDEDIIVIPHEDKGNVSIETKKGVSNVEFKYVKKVLIELLRTVEKKPVPNKEKEVVPKISPKDKYNKLFDFDLVQATAVNKGWKVDVTQNVDGDYETITFIRGEDVIKVFPHENNASIETDKGTSDIDYKYAKKTLLELIKTVVKPNIPDKKVEPTKIKLTQIDFEKLFRYNEIKRIAQQAGWKQTIQFAPKSDTLNKSYAKFVKDKSEILFKPHDESGDSVLMVNGKLNFVPYKDVYKKITTLLNK